MFKKFLRTILLSTAVMLVCICLKTETRFKQTVYEDMYEIEKDTKQCSVNELAKRDSTHIQRISDCFMTIGGMDFTAISGIVLPYLEKADKIRVMLLAARLGEEGREALTSLFTDGIDSSDINKACTILCERLTDREMAQVADMTEKYTAVVKDSIEKERIK